MKIFRSIKGNQLNQGFGAANTPLALLKTYTDLGHLGHEGWDWGVHCQDYGIEHGGVCEPAYFDLDIKAVVTSIQQDDKYGFGVVARSEDSDGIFEHLWWHFDSISPAVLVGTTLESGDFLGITGRTGRATGDHLHRELRPLGKDVYGNYYKKEPNNGYGGAIDPTPYFVNEFVLDVVNNLTSQVGILQKLVSLVKQKLGL